MKLNRFVLAPVLLATGSLALFMFAPTVQAGSFSFSYTFLDGTVVAGTIGGELLPDGNTVEHLTNGKFTSPVNGPIGEIPLHDEQMFLNPGDFEFQALSLGWSDRPHSSASFSLFKGDWDHISYTWRDPSGEIISSSSETFDPERWTMQELTAFGFSYTFLDGTVVAGTIDGELQPDGNTVEKLTNGKFTSPVYAPIGETYFHHEQMFLNPGDNEWQALSIGWSDRPHSSASFGINKSDGDHIAYTWRDPSGEIISSSDEIPFDPERWTMQELTAFGFSYTFLDGTVVAGTIDGELQPDGNTVEKLTNGKFTSPVYVPIIERYEFFTALRLPEMFLNPDDNEWQALSIGWSDRPHSSASFGINKSDGDHIAYIWRDPSGEIISSSSETFDPERWTMEALTPPDSDQDGIPDDQDACPDSDMRPTIFINGINTWVDNELLEDGCTLADLVDSAVDEEPDSAALVALLVDMKAEGLISGREMGQILRAANAP